MKSYFKCNTCNSKKIKILHIIKKYPICGGPVVDSEAGKRIQKDKIIIGFCLNCGSCSLVCPPPEKTSFELYDASYTSSNMAVALGARVDSKRRNFIKLITGLNLKRRSKLLEIGCYDGSLLMEFKKLGFKVFGCEPSPVAKIGVEKYHLSIENRYFSPNLYGPDFFTLVALRNVLEHIFDPVSFLCSIRKVIVPKGFIALEVPDGFCRIQEGILGSIVPEHPNYFWSRNLKMLLISSGFSNVKIKNYKGGLLVTAQKNDIPEKTLPLKLKLPSLSTLKRIEACYEFGIRKNLKRHKEIFSLLKENLVQNSKVIIFGANTHSLELLVQRSLKKELVRYVIDDDPLKWGKKLVGFGIPVKPRSVLEKYNNKDIFVICSFYSQDIIIDFLKKSLPKSSLVLKTYPTVKLISF